MALNSSFEWGHSRFKNRGDDKHAGRTAIKTFANDLKLHVILFYKDQHELRMAD